MQRVLRGETHSGATSARDGTGNSRSLQRTERLFSLMQQWVEDAGLEIYSARIEVAEKTDNVADDDLAGLNCLGLVADDY